MQVATRRLKTLQNQFTGSELATHRSVQTEATSKSKDKDDDTLPSDFYKFDELLSVEQRNLRKQIRTFASTHIAPIIHDFYERAEFPMEVVSKLKSLNLCGADIPREYGGPGLSGLDSGLIAMELARVDVGIATFFGILQPISMSPIFKGGSEEQKRKYLPAMAKLDQIGCFCLTEPEAGSDASHLKLTATPVPGGWELNGKKRWIGNGTFADIFLVWATNTETKQVNGFIVERKNNPGITTVKIENKIALRAVQNADITFEKCFVPDSQRLPGATNFSTGPAKSLFLTRVIAAWIAVGATMGAFDACVAYLKERKQFGSPLAKFQLHQGALAKMLGNIQAMILMAWRVSVLYDNKTLTFGQVGLAKATVTRLARRTVSMARAAMGGNGIVTDFGVAKQFADMEAVFTYEGTYDINSLIAAREVTGFSSFRN